MNFYVCALLKADNLLVFMIKEFTWHWIARRSFMDACPCDTSNCFASSEISMKVAQLWMRFCMPSLRFQ